MLNLPAFILASCLTAWIVLSSCMVGSATLPGSAAHLITRDSTAGLSAVIIAATRGSIFRLIQLSSLTVMLGISSTFLDANNIRCNGDTIVIPLQDTVLVLIFSLNTK